MRALLAVVMLAACGDDASHVALPHVVSHGGRVLDELSLVTITYPDDPLADVARRFDDAVLRTRWLGAVGAEYGVHGGDHVASYTMPAAAPAHMTYGDLAAIPGALLAAGAVPGRRMTACRSCTSSTSPPRPTSPTMRG